MTVERATGDLVSLYGDPDELDRLARRLVDRAGEVRGHADQVTNRAHAAHWQSTAAGAYRHVAAGDRARLHHCADEMEAAAARLRAHAQEMRERIAEIRRIEAAVRGWFVDTATAVRNTVVSTAGKAVDSVSGIVGDALEGKPPWHDWPFTPDTLPMPGSVDWLDAGEFFRKQGVL